MKQHLMLLHAGCSSSNVIVYSSPLVSVFLGVDFPYLCMPKDLYTVVRRHLNIFCEIYEQEGKQSSQKRALTFEVVSFPF